MNVEVKLTITESVDDAGNLVVDDGGNIMYTQHDGMVLQRILSIYDFSKIDKSGIRDIVGLIDEVSHVTKSSGSVINLTPGQYSQLKSVVVSPKDYLKQETRTGGGSVTFDMVVNNLFVQRSLISLEDQFNEIDKRK